MKPQVVVVLVSALLTTSAAAHANDAAIASCGPNDGYVTLYTSVDTFEMAGRLTCGVRLELLESQKTYAAQQTKYLRVATEDGKQGYVARSAVTLVSNPPPAVRAAGPNPASAATLVATPLEMRVLDGTELSVRLTSDLSSGNASEGQTISLEVAQPLASGGATIFARGAAAHARITHVKPAARWGQQGEIFWAMQDVTAVDGTLIRARFVGEPQGPASIPSTGILAASGNTMLVEQSAFSLHKGHAAFVPAGQIFKVYLQGDTVIRLTPTRAIAPSTAASN